MKKVMFVSSTGGHLTELLTLEPLFKEYDYLLVTEYTDTTKDMNNKYNVEYLKYGSRFYPFKYIFVVTYNIFKCLKLLFKFRPETIVSTGAHTGGIMCFIGKFFKAKIIYIETLAKVDSLSVTGNNVYKIADKFYVQWKSLAKKYDKTEYIGRLM